MNLLPKYIPFQFLTGLIFGILIQFYTDFWSFGRIQLSILLLIFTSLLLFFRWKNLKQAFTLTCYFIFIFLGISTTYFNDFRTSDDYFGKQHSRTSILEISEILKPNDYNLRFYVDVIQQDNYKSCGKVLVSIERDSTLKHVEIGQQILTSSNFTTISKPKNPNGFDYADYLNKHNIHQQIFLKSNQYKILKTSSVSIFGIAQKFRNRIKKSLKKRNFSSETFGIINALLLGDRTLISKNIRENYINAGVIHILAISGLHIGILLYILLFIFRPLEKLKHGTILKSVLVVLLLWFFAFLSGLSASVARAVTMFSFVVLGELIQRKTYIEFSLISSMLVLLLIKPLFIFDVGFQLSYLAVFGIVWIRPLFLKIWNPYKKQHTFFWNLITVSISAQIAILPLSLYYFHQFSSLFLVSNLVILPWLGFILGYGIFVICCSLLNINFQPIYTFYELIINLLNRFVEFISGFQNSILKGISMSFWQMLLWYLVIFFGYKLLSDFKPKFTLAFLSSILVLQSVTIFEKWTNQQQEELIIFQQSKASTIGLRNGKYLKVFSNSNNLNFIENYKASSQISSVEKDTIPNIFRFKSDTFLVVDSLGIYQLKSLKNPIVILRKSPKINLERLISELHPKEIISDGSNYKSYVERWKLTCLKCNIPFHNTYDDGFWVY